MKTETKLYGLAKGPVIPVDRSKKYRVILTGDIACEVDDLYAAAYALMSEKLDVVGLCSEQWGDRWSKTSMEDGYQELLKLTEAMGVTDVPICRGATKAISLNEETGKFEYEMNEASQLIINEAMKADDRPLVICCTGPMTNTAIAYLEKPEIAGRMYVVGNDVPTDGWEFNLGNDCHATNILMDSNVEWYLNNFHSDLTYKATLTSLYQELKNCGAVGEYLWNRTVFANEQLAIRIAEDIRLGFVGQGLNEVELKGCVPNGELFELNDIGAVARVLSMGYSHIEMVDARHLTRMVNGLDHAYIPVRQLKSFTNATDVAAFMKDFYDKLQYYYGE